MWAWDWLGLHSQVSIIYSTECSLSENIDITNAVNVNNGLQDTQPDAASCRSFCRPKSPYFTWVGSNFHDATYHSSCWCKTTRDGTTGTTGAISGTTDSSQDGGIKVSLNKLFHHSLFSSILFMMGWLRTISCRLRIGQDWDVMQQDNNKGGVWKGCKSSWRYWYYSKHR